MSQLVYILSHALIHSLWQFTLIAIAMWAGLKLVPNSKAKFRCILASIALYVAIIVFFATCYLIDKTTETPTVLAGNIGGSQGGLPTIVVALWFCGLVWSGLKISQNVFGVIRLSREPYFFLPSSLKPVFENLITRSKFMRPISIRLSESVQTACTIGFWRPVLFLPISITSHLGVDEIEAIIAHELAHIMRHDFLHRCIQSVIETLFYYHPAVHYISRIILREREHACDDLAVTLIGNCKPLATGLLKSGLVRNTNTLILNAVSEQTLGLSDRINRLVTVPLPEEGNVRKRRKRHTLFGLFATVLLLLVCSPSQPLLANASSLKFSRSEIIGLKDEVCAQLKTDNIYWNPKYDQGGPAKVNVRADTVYMNGVPLPRATQKALLPIFQKRGLTGYENISIKYYGDQVKLALTPNKENGNTQIDYYLLKAGNIDVTHFRKPKDKNV